ncbi:LytTR family DNA-binding domain-containing protein [Pseudolactococcus yaeyamensis]
MNIFILEDEIVQQFRLETFINEYIKKASYSVDEIIACSKPTELFSALEGKTRNNIYFLDIKIKNKATAGLEAAEKIRKLDPLGQITFITTHTEYASLTYEYKVDAHDFISKLLPQEAFDQKIIENIVDFFDGPKVQTSSDIFTYQTRTGKLIEARYQDIYFFEIAASSHQILLQMRGEAISFYGSLNDIVKKSKHLVRVHRGAIVNVDKIYIYLRNNKKIKLENDMELEVSRSGAKLLKVLSKTKHFKVL